MVRTAFSPSLGKYGSSRWTGSKASPSRIIQRSSVGPRSTGPVRPNRAVQRLAERRAREAGGLGRYLFGDTPVKRGVRGLSPALNRLSGHALSARRRVQVHEPSLARTSTTVTCKERPSDSRKKSGAGASRAFIPWCEADHSRKRR